MFSYLPVRYKTVEELTDNSTLQLSRMKKLRALHDALNFVNQPLEIVCLSGMRCVTSDAHRIVLHFFLRCMSPTYRKL